MKPERWQQIEWIFNSALERDPVNRPGYVREACAQDVELLETVEQLLAEQSRARKFMERPAFEQAARALAGTLGSDRTDSLTGRLLSHYQVLEKIGDGGMGVVYRARDNSLRRPVALKILPEILAADPEYRARFEREARLLASLNHPNVAAIYGLEESGGLHFLVLELVEGQTLRERIYETVRNKPDESISSGQVLDLAMQIVEGMSAAHKQGIIHRDLKPANIKLTPEGRLKILDFGLARLQRRQGESDSGSDLPLEERITNPGVVMGTVSYMAPEQVRGEEADSRTDIFAFGLILYEMISGRHAFERESAAEIISAILRDDPPELSAGNHRICPRLEKVVRRCLEKKPEHRFQSASEIGFALETISNPSAPVNGSVPAVWENFSRNGRLAGWLSRIRPAGIPILFISLGVLGALLLLLFWPGPGTPVELVTQRFSISLPEKAAPANLVLSPDGRHLVFTATVEGKTQLWLRPLHALAAHPLQHTEGVNGCPFWSPDSRFLVYVANGTLRKLDLASETQQVLCSVPTIFGDFGGAWGQKDTLLLFGGGIGSGMILRVSAAGGKPEPVSGIDSPHHGMAYRWPCFLPDGNHFLFLATSSPRTESMVFLASIDGEKPIRLVPADSNAVYAGSEEGNGYLLFAREAALLAQPFDARSHRLLGEPFRLSEQVRVDINSLGNFSVSGNGTLIYDSRSEFRNHQLAWFDRAGQRLGVIGPPGSYGGPRISPDGRWVAVQSREMKAGSDIDIINLQQGTSSKLTFDPAEDYWPVWSPDGNSVVWASNRGGKFGLYHKPVSGAGQDVLLVPSDVTVGPTDWSSDGRFILFERFALKTKVDLWLLPLQGDRIPMPLLQTAQKEESGRFSPDMRWFAYDSDESGRQEVYVQTFPVSGGKWQVSTSGGKFPRWRGDGKEIFYFSGDGKMVAAEARSGATFDRSETRVLFDLSEAGIPLNSIYAVTADGQRFLFRVEALKPPMLTIVINWMAERKKQLPG